MRPAQLAPWRPGKWAPAATVAFSEGSRVARGFLPEGGVFPTSFAVVLNIWHTGLPATPAAQNCISYIEPWGVGAPESNLPICEYLLSL